MGRSEADQRFERLLRAIGYSVLALGKASMGRGDTEPVVHEVRILLHADNRTSVLLVIKAVRGDDRLIAFVGGPDIETALVSLKQRLAGGTLRWREDVPYTGPR